MYDRIGTGYARHRRADPRLARVIHDALDGCQSVLNVGAGTGSYEPARGSVVAVDASMVMLSQRPAGSAPVVQSLAEALPVRSGSFDAAMAVLSVHHWSDWRSGVDELNRVAVRRVVLAFDAERHADFWLVDYIPELRGCLPRGAAARGARGSAPRRPRDGGARAPRLSGRLHPRLLAAPRAVPRAGHSSVRLVLPSGPARRGDRRPARPGPRPRDGGVGAPVRPVGGPTGVGLGPATPRCRVGAGAGRGWEIEARFKASPWTAVIGDMRSESAAGSRGAVAARRGRNS